MALTPLEMLYGIFSVIYVIISVITGLFIALKYRETKQYVFIFIGISSAGIATPFWSSSISFIIAVLTGEGLSEASYFLIGNFFIPVALLSWMIGLTDLIYRKYKKIIILIYVITGVIFEVYLVYYLYIFQDPSVIGILKSVVDVEYIGFTRYYLIFAIITTDITGIHFSIQGIKSADDETKLKAKFLIIGFISFTVGIIADGFMTLDFITIPIIRLLLISSAIEFYIGWTLPKSVKKLFLKTE